MSVYVDSDLKNGNLKYTKKREEILSVLKTRNSPITAEEIYDVVKSNNINLSTVYRTLLALEKAGIVDKVLRSDKKCYYNIKKKSHGHYLVCKNCNKAISLDICPINDLCKKITNETGYEITGHMLELEGICPDCKK